MNKLIWLPGLGHGARLTDLLKNSWELKTASIASIVLNIVAYDSLNFQHPYLIIGAITALIHLVSIVVKAHINERRELIEKLYVIGKEAEREKLKEQEARHMIANKIGDAMLVIGHLIAKHEGTLPPVVDRVLNKLTADKIYSTETDLHLSQAPVQTDKL